MTCTPRTTTAIHTLDVQYVALLQRVAACCSVLQRAAACCSVLQCIAVCCSEFQCVAMCCSVPQCVAIFCSMLQFVFVFCCVLQCVVAGFCRVLYGLSSTRLHIESWAVLMECTAFGLEHRTLLIEYRALLNI